MKVRINDNTISSVSACVYPTLNDTGVEIASVYLLSGFVRASVKINESAPHFLCLKNLISIGAVSKRGFYYGT